MDNYDAKHILKYRVMSEKGKGCPFHTYAGVGGCLGQGGGKGAFWMGWCSAWKTRHAGDHPQWGHPLDGRPTQNARMDGAECPLPYPEWPLEQRARTARSIRLPHKNRNKEQIFHVFRALT